jgi:hypothetical protein
MFFRSKAYRGRAKVTKYPNARADRNPLCVTAHVAVSTAARVSYESTWEIKDLFTVGDSYFEIGNGVNVY